MMRKLGKCLILAATISGGGTYFSSNLANAAAGADDLYSESIYIHKSSAEIPESLDSNASPQADRNIKTPEAKPIESLTDMESTTPGKKLSQRANDQPSTNN